MEPKIIKTDAEYSAALKAIERLWDAEPGTRDGERAELWTLLIEDYERQHFPIDLPDPVSAIKFRMEQAGLKAKDLIPYIGSAGKVSEVLSGKRTLSLSMIRALHEGLGIPAEVLLGKQKTSIPSEVPGIDWDRLPIAEMRSRGWFADFSGSLGDARQRAEELIRGMVSSISFNELQPVRLRCKVRDGGTQDDHALFAWHLRILSLCEYEELQAFQPGTICENFIHDLVHFSAFDEGPCLARKWLNQYGVHLIVEPHLKKTHLDGAAMWHRGHPVVALTLRYDRLDNFWFTLAHELAHLALHITEPSLDSFMDDIVSRSDNKEEAEADQLATSSLIPDEEWNNWYHGRKAPAATVRAFAKRLRVHPCLVAGRIRREKNDYRLYNAMVNKVSVRHTLGVADQFE